MRPIEIVAIFPSLNCPPSIGERSYMTADHALFLQGLPYLHQDPFDRLLISQALVEDLVLVTADKAISQYPVQIV